MNYKSKHVLCGLALVSFCLSTMAASAAEIQLAGIKLGRPAISIIKKYGNPSEIKVGAAKSTEAVNTAGAPGLPDMSGIHAQYSAPGMPPAALGVHAGTAINQQPAGPPEVTWVYKFSNNRTLEFLLNPDGVVIQISAYGAAWLGLHTAKGIGLGSTYKDVIVKYGYPESHEQKGIELLTKYHSKDRASFTIVGKSVVGITIALMD